MSPCCAICSTYAVVVVIDFSSDESFSVCSFAVDGLEKASLANCDVVVGGTQAPQLKQKGKLSTLGKIFKPWKWRKKRTSEKFQDLSKGRPRGNKNTFVSRLHKCEQ